MGGGQAVKSYIYIRDVSKGELNIMEKGKPGEIYHLSPDGNGISIRELVREICFLQNKDFEENTIGVSERLGQDKAYTIDSSKARNKFNWSPEICLSEGITEVIKWIEDNWSEIRRSPLEYIHQA